MLMQCIGRPQVARLARSINKHYDNFILALALARLFLWLDSNGITVVLSAKRSTGRHKVATKKEKHRERETETERERMRAKNTNTMRIRVRNYLVLDCAQTGDCFDTRKEAGGRWSG